MQAYESVTRFLEELRNCSFPSAAIFDRADLDAADSDDRCIPLLLVMPLA